MENVVLLTIDCLRYDRCGFAGHIRNTTPTLDELAADAIVFDEAYATGMRTAESVPGILAGLLSADCAYYDELQLKALPEGAETLASWLRDRGYDTFARISNPQLTAARNFDLGFDDFANLRTTDDGPDTDETGSRTSIIGSLFAGFRSSLRRWKARPGPNPLLLAFLAYRHQQLRSGWPTVDGRTVVSELCGRIERADEPFFGWAHLNDLHAPLHPERVRAGGLDSARDTAQFRWDARRVLQVESPNYHRMYDSALRYVDGVIDRCIDRLKALGVWEETVLVVTADHGESLYDRGVYGHGAGFDQFDYQRDRHYLYDDLLHVPLIVRSPSVTGRRCSDAISLGWLHELLSDVVGLDPGTFDTGGGYSTVGEHARSPTPVVADAITHHGHTIAVRRGGVKYISPLATEPADVTATDGEWYNVAADRSERIPLHRAADAELVEHAQRVVTNPEAVPSLGGTVSTETGQLLEALGYT